MKMNALDQKIKALTDNQAQIGSQVLSTSFSGEFEKRIEKCERDIRNTLSEAIPKIKQEVDFQMQVTNSNLNKHIQTFNTWKIQQE